MKHPLTLILYNIRSTHNVGSILRTADCAGVAHVYLTGSTPAPIDRFGRARKDVAKVALGAEHTVSWEYVGDVHTAIEKAREAGIRIIALEQNKRSVPYNDFTLDRPTALILGEEVHGIPDDICDMCDDVLEIPLHGEKESLNVSVAAGISIFRLIEKST